MDKIRTAESKTVCYRLFLKGRVQMMREKKLRQLQLRKNRTRRKMFILLAAAILISGIIYSSFKIIVQAKEKQHTYKYYTDIRIHRGDTLWDIANEYMTEEYDSIDSYIDEVCRINSIYDNNIYYGQTLMIPYYSSEFK